MYLSDKTLLSNLAFSKTDNPFKVIICISEKWATQINYYLLFELGFIPIADFKNSYECKLLDES